MNRHVCYRAHRDTQSFQDSLAKYGIPCLILYWQGCVRGTLLSDHEPGGPECHRPPPPPPPQEAVAHRCEDQTLRLSWRRAQGALA